MWEIGTIVALTIFIVTAIVSVILSIRYGKTLTNNVMTKGMNGVAGSTLDLTCPSGQVISFKNNNPTTSRAVLICTGDSGCDAFWSQSGQQSNFFNTQTTIDLLSSKSPIGDISACAGRQQCTVIVPDASDSRIPSSVCLKGCKGRLQLIGTYDCVAA